MTLLLKDIDGFPEKKQQGACYISPKDYNRHLTEIGNLELEPYLRENGWVKLAEIAKGTETDWAVDVMARAKGYIKLSDVEIDEDKVKAWLYNLSERIHNTCHSYMKDKIDASECRKQQDNTIDDIAKTIKEAKPFKEKWSETGCAQRQ